MDEPQHPAQRPALRPGARGYRKPRRHSGGSSNDGGHDPASRLSRVSIHSRLPRTFPVAVDPAAIRAGVRDEGGGWLGVGISSFGKTASLRLPTGTPLLTPKTSLALSIIDSGVINPGLDLAKSNLCPTPHVVIGMLQQMLYWFSPPFVEGCL